MTDGEVEPTATRRFTTRVRSEMRAEDAGDDGQAAIAAAGQVGWTRPRGVGRRWKRRRRCGGIGRFFPGSHRELHAAVGVSEGDTAGGGSSSRPGVEGVLARALEVHAEGGSAGFQNTNSLRSWQCLRKVAKLLPLGGNMFAPGAQQGRHAEPGCRASRAAHLLLLERG